LFVTELLSRHRGEAQRGVGAFKTKSWTDAALKKTRRDGLVA